MFRFPYDTQICHLDFGNVIETDVFVNISLYIEFADLILEFFSPSNEFILENAHANRKTEQVCHMESKHPTVLLKVSVKYSFIYCHDAVNF